MAGADNKTSALLHKALSDRVLLPLICLLVAAVYLYQFDEPTGYDYYPGVIELPAAAMSGTPVECASEAVAQAGEEGLDPMEQLHKEFESLNVDQRLGQPVLLMPFYIALGPLGFRVAYALWRVALFLTVFFLIRRLTGSRLAAYSASLVLVFNPFMLIVRSLNPNIETVVLTGLCFLLLLEAPRWRAGAALGGAVAGTLFGVAHAFVAMLTAPALAVLLLFPGGEGKRSRLKRAGWFAVGFLPVLVLWSGLYASLKEPLPIPVAMCIGDTQIIGGMGDDFSRKMIDGASGATEAPPPKSLCDRDYYLGWYRHRLGPITVTIWGMLGWPFYDFVRSPGIPYSQHLFIPMLWIRSFGLLFFGLFLLGLTGIGPDPRQNPGPLAAALLWFFWFSFLAVQENLPGGSKLTYPILTFLPLTLLGGVGLASLLQKAGWKRLIALAVAVPALALLVLGSQKVEVPMDPRWHERFVWKDLEKCMDHVDRVRAADVRKTLSSPSLLPAGGLDLLFSVWDHPGKKSADFLSETDPVHPVPSSMSALVYHAIQELPENAYVVINPYAAPGLAALADPQRCVSRAPILKPKFYFDFSSGTATAQALPGETPPIFYVDIPGIPTGSVLTGFNKDLVLFNGYCTVHSMDSDPFGGAVGPHGPVKPEGGM